MRSRKFSRSETRTVVRRSSPFVRTSVSPGLGGQWKRRCRVGRRSAASTTTTSCPAKARRSRDAQPPWSSLRLTGAGHEDGERWLHRRRCQEVGAQDPERLSQRRVRVVPQIEGGSLSVSNRRFAGTSAITGAASFFSTAWALRGTVAEPFAKQDDDRARRRPEQDTQGDDQRIARTDGSPGGATAG